MSHRPSDFKLLGILSTAILLITLAACQGKPTTTTTTTSATSHPGLPLVTFATGDFAGSGNCAVCHSSLIDSSGADVSIDSQWRSTMLANAAKDPYFLAKAASEVALLPNLKQAVEDACAVCHMPMARTQALTDGKAVAVLGDGFLNPANELNKAALDGVSCTLCHQVQPDNLGQSDSFEGNYVIDTSTEAPDRPIFGQFPGPLQAPMQSMVGFTPVQGEQISDPGLCATCHNVITPYVNDQGDVAGTFPEQMPYTEWSNSAYGKTPGQQMPCQSCHMPTTGSTAISNNPTGLDQRTPFSQHQFVGGNTIMLEIMRAHIQDLGITASTEQLEATIALVLDQLQNRAAQLSVVNSQLSGNSLELGLRVSDQTGHKFPTSFPSRRVWIHLTITDSTGKVVFESGKPNADGSISGDDADDDITAFEPHYDVITDADQVQIYESIMGDTDGHVTYHLLKGATYLKDNRILPAGFDKTTAPDEVAVHGAALNDGNFTGGSDAITYQLNLTGKGPFTITASLLYQSISYQASRSLTGDSQLISQFQDYFQAADRMPTVIATVTKSIS